MSDLDARLTDPLPPTSAKAPSPHISAADEWRASRCSRLFFSWIFPLLRLGAKRPLQRTDLGCASRADEVAQHAEAFTRAFAVHRSTRRALRAAFWKYMPKGAACKGLGDAASYVQIWAVKTIITFAESSVETDGSMQWPRRAIGSYFKGSPEAPSSPGEPRVVDLAIALLVVAPIIQGVALHWFYHFVMLDIMDIPYVRNHLRYF